MLCILRRNTDREAPKFMTFRTKQAKAKCIKSKFTTNKPQPAEKWKWNENAASIVRFRAMTHFSLSVLSVDRRRHQAQTTPPSGATTTLAYWQANTFEEKRNEVKLKLPSWNWNQKTNSPIDCCLIGLRCVYLIYFELCQLIIVFSLTCRCWLSWLHNFIVYILYIYIYMVMCGKNKT